MGLAEDLRELPDEAMVPVGWLRDRLEGESGPESAEEEQMDLTVEEAAELVDRSPSTVRGWLVDGEIGRAYKFHGQWRIPRSALVAYVRQGDDPEPGPRDQVEKSTDLGAWRGERGV